MTKISEIDIDLLIEENRFLRKLLKEAPVSIHINNVDKHGHNMPVWVNDQYEKLIGYSLEERKSMGLKSGNKEIYHEDDTESIKKAIKYMMADRNCAESIIFRFYRKNGEQKWLYTHSKPIEYNGDPNHFLSFGFDVTDKLVLNHEQLDKYTKEIARLKNQIKINQLTKTEKEIIKDLSHGLSTQQIADKRGRSYETVNNQKRKIFRKLELNKLSELVCFAKDSGLD